MRDASASPVIPDWVPGCVAAVALKMELQITQRLVVDPRMEAVWRTLKSRKINGDLAAIDDLQKPEAWEVDCVSVSDRACVGYFVAAAIQFGVVGPSIAGSGAKVTKSSLANLLKRWRDVALECRRAEHYPAFIASGDDNLKEALERVARRFDEYATFVEKANAESAYILPRSSRKRNDDLIRGQTRALAAATRKIFGEFLYGTVATTASVASGHEIKDASVRDWCADLA